MDPYQHRPATQMSYARKFHNEIVLRAHVRSGVLPYTRPVSLRLEPSRWQHRVPTWTSASWVEETPAFRNRIVMQMVSGFSVSRDFCWLYSVSQHFSLKNTRFSMVYVRNCNESKAEISIRFRENVKNFFEPEEFGVGREDSQISH